jgi:hypothetical protein
MDENSPGRLPAFASPSNFQQSFSAGQVHLAAGLT